MNNFNLRKAILEDRGECGNYCSHGGACNLFKGHQGKHDSDYCQWETSESLTAEEADKIINAKMDKRGL